MALPKTRHSQTRGRKRRTHWKVAKPAVSVCSNCETPVLPHRVCTACGFYKGQKVLAVKEA
ncbi:MAG: 50S ribosomal protein L32 [Nitrospinota bacterium]|jgi:large subunit ribosomal protein L32|nr:50S ribosomal protein L32 [Nitrospinota bacterium]MDP6365470.1 50S ribosomal protein L32 [Nitrospinota bacterium]MDP7168180.1 50S ribosomal protein L32 [Nitrospinota bacterium]MDP7369058.1 50S ribosomal protein L32 [Nitrospinota bacterium]MDP7502711.1 50S ribosomal protein L32 [Nitrospinota bacterium]